MFTFLQPCVEGFINRCVQYMNNLTPCRERTAKYVISSDRFFWQKKLSIREAGWFTVSLNFCVAAACKESCNNDRLAYLKSSFETTTYRRNAQKCVWMDLPIVSTNDLHRWEQECAMYSLREICISFCILAKPMFQIKSPLYLIKNDAKTRGEWRYSSTDF